MAPRNVVPTTEHGSYQGVVSGTSVTITVQGLFSGAALSGQLDGNTLTLSFPSADGSMSTAVFKPGTTDDYNAGVQAVQASAGVLQSASDSSASVQSSIDASSAAVAEASNQAQAAIQQVDSAVDDAAQPLSTDTATITYSSPAVTDALTEISNALDAQNRDLADVQTAATKAASDLQQEGKNGTDVCSDAGTVEDDASTVADDESTVQDASQDDPTQGLMQAISNLQTDEQKFETAQSAAPNYTPEILVPSPTELKTAISTGQSLLAKWTKDTASALATAKATTAQAQGIADKISGVTGC